MFTLFFTDKSYSLLLFHCSFCIFHVHFSAFSRCASVIRAFNPPPGPAAPLTRSVSQISRMRRGVMLINTSRGALLDTAAVVAALNSRQIGSLGIDVYEKEQDGLFFNDLSSLTDGQPGASLPDDWDEQLSALGARPNVLVTPHSAFLTAEALHGIAETTVTNLKQFAQGGECANAVCTARDAQ
eukprot:3258594-Pleurochrysis_carterae.AAC.1